MALDVADAERRVREIAEVLSTQAEGIYVRAQVDGGWKSVALTDLPAEEAIRHAVKFFLNVFDRPSPPASEAGDGG